FVLRAREDEIFTSSQDERWGGRLRLPCSADVHVERLAVVDRARGRDLFEPALPVDPAPDPGLALLQLPRGERAVRAPALVERDPVALGDRAAVDRDLAEVHGPL